MIISNTTHKTLKFLPDFVRNAVQSTMGRHHILLVVLCGLELLFVGCQANEWSVKGDEVRLSAIVNERPQVMNSTVPRSNLDVWPCMNCDSSSFYF